MYLVLFTTIPPSQPTACRGTNTTFVIGVVIVVIGVVIVVIGVLLLGCSLGWGRYQALPKAVRGGGAVAGSGAPFGGAAGRRAGGLAAPFSPGYHSRWRNR